MAKKKVFECGPTRYTDSALCEMSFIIDIIKAHSLQFNVHRSLLLSLHLSVSQIYGVRTLCRRIMYLCQIDYAGWQDGSRNSSGKFARRCVINKYDVGEKLTNIQICRYMYKSIKRLLSAINEFIQFQMKMLSGCVAIRNHRASQPVKKEMGHKGMECATETHALLKMLAVSRYFRHNYICILATPPPLQTET